MSFYKNCHCLKYYNDINTIEYKTLCKIARLCRVMKAWPNNYTA